MPADITGTEILQQTDHERRMTFVQGPLFANMILADEINRTPPKTQAALPGTHTVDLATGGPDAEPLLVGEVRDAGHPENALQFKSLLLGQNPCNVDMIFRTIKKFGNWGREGGGVSGIEIALWDLVGKVYGVPCYQFLGGKYRSTFRPLNDAIMSGRIRGVAAVVGCNNPRSQHDYLHTYVTKELLKQDVLVVETGCGAIASAKLPRGPAARAKLRAI